MSDKALRLKDGTRVPGSTTVISQLAKDYLIPWANRLGMRGIDSTKYTNDAARRGTLLHLILESHVTHEGVELDEKLYPESDIQKSLIHLDYFKDWEKEHKLECIWCEHSLVSEQYKYGGIIDFYAKIDDKYTIVDFKTSKQINEEYFLQLSSYVQLFKENNLEVEQVMIINVGKNDSDKFMTETRSVEELDNYFKLFKHLVELYWLKKEIGWKD